MSNRFARPAGRPLPKLIRHPVLRALVKASLGARIALTPGALIISLGTAADNAVCFLAADGLADRTRCRQDFLIHPAATATGQDLPGKPPDALFQDHQMGRASRSALPAREGTAPEPETAPMAGAAHRRMCPRWLLEDTDTTRRFDLHGGEEP